MNSQSNKSAGGRIRAIAGRLLILAAAATLPATVVAAPEWNPRYKEIPQVLAQTGKGLVLYFETQGAAACRKMENETWGAIGRERADDFVWLRVNPRDHADFFEYWQVIQVPYVIIMDCRFGEKVHLKGFIPPERMAAHLSEVPRGKPWVLTTADGRVLVRASEDETLAHHTMFEDQKSFYAENFDDVKYIGGLRRRQFVPVNQSASRIAQGDGILESACLIIDSAKRRGAAMRVDLYKGLKDVEQIVGRMRFYCSVCAFIAL